MNSAPADVISKTTQELLVNATHSSKTKRERWAIWGVFAIVGMIISFAIWHTVGEEVLRHAGRLVFRRIAPLAAPASPPEAREAGKQSRVGSLPADSMIAVPRSRNSALKPIVDAAGDNKLPVNLPIPAEVEPEIHKAVTAEKPASATVPDGALLSGSMLKSSGRLLSHSWQDFAYPVIWSATETSRSRMIFVGHRNRLLRGISHPHPSQLSLDQFRKDYAAAREQFSGDPRVDYAFGLVLWKHGKRGEAIETFQIAARLDQTPFLPAALAVAWGRFLVRDDHRALDQLAHVARCLAVERDNYPTESQKEQAAILIGRALGYLAGRGRTPELAEKLELSTRNIMDRLPSALHEACESGRREVAIRESELLALSDLPHEEIDQNIQRQQKQMQDQIEILRQEMKVARDVLTRGHRTHVESIRELLKGVVNVRGQMDKLKPMIQRMKDTVYELTQSKGHLKVIQLPTHYTLLTPTRLDQVPRPTAIQGVMTVLGPETPAERAARITQLSKAKVELSKIETQLSELRDQQRELVAARHEADEKAKLEKDQVRRIRLSRIKEQKDLDSRLASLRKAFRHATNLRDSLDTIAAYVPWNVEVEGEALWTALGLSQEPISR